MAGHGWLPLTENCVPTELHGALVLVGQGGEFQEVPNNNRAVAPLDAGGKGKGLYMLELAAAGAILSQQSAKSTLV